MLLDGYIQVKSLHGPALAYPHPPVRSALHTSRDRAAAYHGKKRNTFLCDHSVLRLDDISRPGKARSCRTAENRSQERLVGTNVQSCPSWVDSLARQAFLIDMIFMAIRQQFPCFPSFASMSLNDR